jgi:hypothetical protein
VLLWCFFLLFFFLVLPLPLLLVPVLLLVWTAVASLLLLLPVALLGLMPAPDCGLLLLLLLLLMAAAVSDTVGLLKRYAYLSLLGPHKAAAIPTLGPPSLTSVSALLLLPLRLAVKDAAPGAALRPAAADFWCAAAVAAAPAPSALGGVLMRCSAVQLVGAGCFTAWLAFRRLCPGRFVSSPLLAATAADAAAAFLASASSLR